MAKTITLALGTLQPRQMDYVRAVLTSELAVLFALYGGARGGGKSWTLRWLAVYFAAKYAGISVLILRETYDELRKNHIRPLRAQLEAAGLATYRDQIKTLECINGSTIEFGYIDEHSVTRYQGLEYQIIMIDEATNHTEFEFETLTACLRTSNPEFPLRFLLSANPGGKGHAWVKRRWIDRDFRGDERPEEYIFTPAKVTDNPALMAASPAYVAMLNNLSPGLREAWRDGRWDVYAGQMFGEFDRLTHVIEPFEVPEHWRRYVAIDYGMDMLAAYLIAVDEHDNAYVMRERYDGRDRAPGAEGLIASEAARVVREMVGDDKVHLYLAPPDLWQRKPETGRSVADIFREAAGINLTQVSNDRIAGWMAIHERLKVEPDEQGQPSARLRIFRGCENLIRTLPLLQYDEKKPNDAATEPHEITHAPDALRYFCVYWTKATAPEVEITRRPWTRTQYEDYYRASADDKKMLLELWGHPRGGRQI